MKVPDRDGMGEGRIKMFYQKNCSSCRFEQSDFRDCTKEIEGKPECSSGQW